MNAEFNWWLLIVGLVIGAGLVWLILADSSRREADVTARERAGEARWIAAELRRAGRRVDDDDVADVLDLHAAYLAAPPPDEPEDETDAAATDPTPNDGTAIDRKPIEFTPTDAAPAEWSPGGAAAPGRPRSDARDQPSPSRTG